MTPATRALALAQAGAHAAQQIKDCVPHGARLGVPELLPLQYILKELPQG